MKIYIVTSKDYSNFCIERIFINKDKAEKYIKLKTKSEYFNYNLEEFETDDDAEMEEIKYVDADYLIEIDNSNNEKISYNFNIPSINTLDEPVNRISRTNYWEFDNSIFKIVIVRPILSDLYDKEELECKYKKICYDLWNQIKSLKYDKGWSEWQIYDWLNTKAQEFVPEHE